MKAKKPQWGAESSTTCPTKAKKLLNEIGKLQEKHSGTRAEAERKKLSKEIESRRFNYNLLMERRK